LGLFPLTPLGHPASQGGDKEMSSSIRKAPQGIPANNYSDFHNRRDEWLKAVMRTRRIPQRAKLLASAMFFCFNQKKFEEEGQLRAWPSIRTLDKLSGQSKVTVKLAIEALRALGY